MSADKINIMLANPDLRAIIEGRFWQKIDRRGPDECWPWTGAVLKLLPYGSFNIGNKVTASAHRVAFAFANNGVPEDKCVLHRCDNPRCCNPSHLFEGTRHDNMKDMWAKGRSNRETASPETRQKMSRAQKGRKDTPETTARRRAAQLGKPGLKGRKFSEQTIARMCAAAKLREALKREKRQALNI